MTSLHTDHYTTEDELAEPIVAGDLLRIGELLVTNSPMLKITENLDREVLIIEFTHA